MFELGMLIAQTSAPAGKPPAQPDFIFGFLVPMGLVMLVLYFFIYRGQKRDRDKHAQMLAALKLNDRVQTIGGIFATVVEVRDNEVVLKVDESNNTKMRFNRAAIKEVLAGDPPGDPAARK